ncbi:MAG: hypothetical protein ACP5IY_02115 [Halothiobacillaceae bacterium]
MLPTRRGPDEDDTPLEGELFTARPGPALPGLGARLSRLLRIFWLISLAVTGWLLWLTVGQGVSGVLDVVLALLLATPLVVLTLVVLGVNQLTSLFSRSADQLQAHLRAQAEGRNARLAAMELHDTLRELRDHAEGLALLGFMLTPGFLGLLGLSVIATLVMIPVALFTLLFALF